MTSVAEGGQGDGDHRQAMVQILPEVAGPDGRSEVGVGGADDPGIGRLGPSAADPADGVLLDGGEELALEGRGKQGDLVQEEGPAVSRLKQAGLGAVGVREGAALEAEQLGLEEPIRNRRTVDIHERAVPAGAVAVEEAGREPLARARLPLQEN